MIKNTVREAVDTMWSESEYILRYWDEGNWPELECRLDCVIANAKRLRKIAKKRGHGE